MTYTIDDIRRLHEIKTEIKDCVFEALEMLTPNSIEYERARAYWYSQIIIALDKDHDFLGSSMCTMDDTINEINGKKEN